VTSPSRLRAVSAVLLAVVAVGVLVAVVTGSGGGPWDRRAEHTPLYSADELRARPDLAEVLPEQVEATRALLGAVAAAGDLTWEPADADVFTSELDGTQEQVVDGHPVLRWTPEHWDSVGTVEVDDAVAETLARAVREALEPLGWTVSTRNTTSAMYRRDLAFRASSPDDGSLQLLALDDGTLRVIALTSAHVARGTEGCDGLGCRPPVADPAEGL
jgi:hypothetical protein